MVYRILILLMLLPLAIVGCANKSDDLANKLPLDEKRPTLILFYADL